MQSGHWVEDVFRQDLDGCATDADVQKFGYVHGVVNQHGIHVIAGVSGIGKTTRAKGIILAMRDAIYGGELPFVANNATAREEMMIAARTKLVLVEMQMSPARSDIVIDEAMKYLAGSLLDVPVTTEMMVR